MKKNLTSKEIRNLFLEFFESKKHQIVEPQSLVPNNDPSLLWINSGVATMKKYFDGTLIPENRRMVNCQKSIRTNDIENVGVTNRHHTLFEMLGNFSIGDYFKKDAIHFAWEFLTSEKWLGLNRELLYVTVYPADIDAYNCWKNEIGLKDDHIIKLEGNFWEIGQGPSGPCSEIFYDRGSEFESEDTPDDEKYPGGENERYLEIWNLVFSQFNADLELDRSEYKELPNKNIDTGMGLERLVSIIQDKKTNYETDLFMPIIKSLEELTGKQYAKGTKVEVQSMRIISDHVRAVTLAIADGVFPSNEGRGYVLRRLIRRAINSGRNIGITKEFLFTLVDKVVEILGDFYMNINEKIDFIKQVIYKEEERFFATLEDGLKIINNSIDVLKQEGKSTISGDVLFKLYDTYGFPLSMSKQIAEEVGFSIDEAGFMEELEQQKNRARAARDDDSSMKKQSEILANLKVDSKYIEGDVILQTRVVAICTNDAILSQLEVGETAYIVLEETLFYAEGGGQVADKGWITFDNAKVKLIDVQKAPNNQHLHKVEVIEGTVKNNDKVECKLEVKNHIAVRVNHSATHLLHKALKEVVGEHVEQAGSYVNDKSLRFDFSHFQALTDEEIHKVEDLVNEKINDRIKVEIAEMTIDDARKAGATALFGEKYGSVVRTVFMGDFSKELCGGSHVSNTGDIGFFKIVKESGIAAGYRRIEAVAGMSAFAHLKSYEHMLKNITVLVGANTTNVTEKIESLLKNIKSIQKENESLKQKLANSELNSLGEKIEVVNNINVLLAKLKNIDTKCLRNIVDNLKQKHNSVAIVIANEVDGRITFVSGVTKDLIEKGVKAGDLVKTIAEICGGNGGGRPDFAQAGGKNSNKIEEGFLQIKNSLQNLK